MVDYYSVLEVTKHSSASDIKKAYRRLALKWHPDKNPTNQEEATTRFKELSEAYEVLSDDKKRKIYDQFGYEGLQEHTNGGGRAPQGCRRHPPGQHYYANSNDFDSDFHAFVFRDPFDVFRDFFGAADPFEDIFADPFGFLGGARPQRNNRSAGSRHHHPYARPAGAGYQQQTVVSSFAPFGGSMGIFGGFGGFGNSLFANMDNFAGGGIQNGGGASVQMFSSSGFYGGPGNASMKSMSTSTNYVNGKKVTTKRVVDNGVETVETFENDVLKSRAINGQQQMLAHTPSGSGTSSGGKTKSKRRN